MAEKRDANEILMGAGDLFLMDIPKGTTLTSVPADDVIETDENNVAHCSGGSSIEYKPTAYEVKNQYGKVVKKKITGEECTYKTGILTWFINNLELLSTGKVTQTVKNGKVVKIFTVGGSNNNLKDLLVRFRTQKDDGNYIRFTMVGQAGNGFSLEFQSDKELTVDAEITAIEFIKDFLFSLEEEFSTTDISAISINHTTLSMKVGAKEALVSTITPVEAYQGVTWTTSDKSKAIVDENGIITAIAAGTVDITATSEQDTTKTVKCTVTITA